MPESLYCQPDEHGDTSNASNLACGQIINLHTKQRADSSCKSEETIRSTAPGSGPLKVSKVQANADLFLLKVCYELNGGGPVLFHNVESVPGRGECD